MMGVDSGCQQNWVCILPLLSAVLGKLVRLLVSQFSQLQGNNDLTHSLERLNGVNYTQGTSGTLILVRDPPNISFLSSRFCETTTLT